MTHETNPGVPDDDGGGPEDEKRRLDRELIELLNELRVAVTGVQVLFAFLLTVPFTQRFGQATEFQRDVYYVTLLCVAAATAFLVAPSPQHRLLFRQRAKQGLVFTANALTIVGLGFLALGVVGVVLLITDLLYDTNTVVVVTIATAATYAVLWYLWPLVRRIRGR